jgi:hypothetical protein
MKINLPFGFRFAHRVKYGRRIYKAVCRSTLEADIPEIDQSALTPALDWAGSVTYSLDGRLFRPLDFMEQGPISVIDLVRIVATLDRLELTYDGPQMRWAIQHEESWARQDFPRPLYVRSAVYGDRNAFQLPPGDQLRALLNLTWVDTDFAQAQIDAKACYERDLRVIDGALWAAVPEPVWVIRPESAAQWRIEIELQPTIWEAALAFSLQNLSKAEQFAELLSLDVVEIDAPVSILDGFVAQRADLTALASGTLALSRDGLFAPEADEGVGGAAGLALIKKALLGAGGSHGFPWGEEKGAFRVGVNRPHLRRRWQFEFDRPEHAPYRDAIWSGHAEVREQAEARTALRHLADIDPEDEDALASLL